MVWKKITREDTYEGSDTMNRKRLGLEIKVKRIKVGWNQTYFAERVRLSQSAVSRIEQGKSDAKISHVDRIVKELDIDLNELLSRKPSPQEKEMEPKRNLRDLHLNIPVELDGKLDEISRFRGEKTHHIVSAIKAYLKRWETEHGGIRTK